MMAVDNDDLDDAATAIASLQHLLFQWEAFKDIITTLSHILLFLDKTYLLSKGTSIAMIGNELWKDNILLNPALSMHWSKVVGDGIQYIRSKDNAVYTPSSNNEDQNDARPVIAPLLKKVFDMWRELNLYFVNEKLVLDSTRSYYSYFSLAIVQKIDFKTEPESAAVSFKSYLHMVCQIIDKEGEKTKNGPDAFLAESTKRVLENSLEQVLISGRLDFLLQGFPLLLQQSVSPSPQDDTLQDLQILYSLLDRVKEHEKMRKEFGDFVKNVGSGIVKNPETDPEMVHSLLALQKALDRVQKESFKSCEKFHQVQREAFASFINQRQNKPAELIALYIDKTMKSGKLDEEEVEVELEGCLRLFRLVHGKDVFEAFYGKSLAKRLLLGKSASIDAEKSMLHKLKSECGAGFTTKLEGMFKDMDLSKEVMASLNENKRWREKKDESGLDVTVAVLTAVYWPTNPQVSLNLPIDFTRCQESFRDFYTNNYNGRRITWAMSLGHCQVSFASEKAGTKDLVVSLYQTITLLLFNTHSTLTTLEVQQMTGMDADDTGRTLLSLSLGKVKILKKSPFKKEVLPTDTWSLNSSFTHPQRRIVVNTIQATETPQEVTQTRERVFEDRAFAVDAAIVRIMKTKKTLSFRSLVAEVFEMVKFPMELADLKKRIESLVERDYLERDEKDPTIYIYLA